MSPSDELPALRTLPPVDLDELIALADLQVRRDRKYLVPISVASDVLNGVDPATRVLTVDGDRCFGYESVYFDTSDLASYLSTAHRRPGRFKVRTRTYVDSGACVLEVKTRSNRGHTVKHRHPYHIDRRCELTDEAHRFIATVEQAAGVVEQLEPSLTTTYHRRTLLLGDSVTRVTIDSELEWIHPSGRSISLPGWALIETKTAALPCSLDRALWRVGSRPISISKYCTGLASLVPDLPSNRWHRVLRRHFGSPTQGTPWRATVDGDFPGGPQVALSTPRHNRPWPPSPQLPHLSRGPVLRSGSAGRS